MQRYKKPSLLKVYNPFTDLEGHIFGFGRVGCLDSKTEIYTFDKKLCKKKLGELPKSFKVLSYNFKEKKKEIKAAKLILTGHKECFEIELENGKKVIATDEHKFFNKNGDEIEVKNLSVGDSLLFDDAISGNIGKTKKNGLYNKNMGFKKGEPSCLLGKTKEDIPSLSKKGNPNYFGHKLSDERKKHLSDIKKGVPNFKIRGDANPSKRPEVRAKHLKKAKIVGENLRKSGRFAGKNNPSYGKVRYPKLQFSKELGHNYRSSWELKVCLLLKRNNINYEYEPQRFRIDAKHTYTPDIKLSDKTYIEVKGPIYDYTIEKMEKFKKINKEIKLICITLKRSFEKMKMCDVLIDYDELIKTGDINEIIKN